MLAAAILCALGVWQIQRAHMKEGLVAVAKTAREAGPTDMHPGTVASAGNARAPGLTYGRHYFVEGRFDGAHQILLNDQVNGQDIGYRVWTPVVLKSGERVMVDRGWIAKDSSPNAVKPDPTAPTGPVRVLGFWRSFPQPGLSFGSDGRCKEGPWPRALNYPDAATVRCQYAAPVVNGLLLLDEKDPNGFVRDWDEDLVGLSPFGHYAYASQWFLMAVVAGIIFLVVNTRRRDT
ncbi:SURF1 family protein [Salinisphaera aquimarina]